MKFAARHAVWLLSIGLVAGCHSAEEQEPVAAAAAHAGACAQCDHNRQVGANTTLANPKVTSAPVAEFKPQFPDRTDMFEPPKRAQNTVRRDDEHGQTVELKGFINVDQPKVVLSIDGVISPIPEGGEKYGVSVISIEPPTVVLQRGRSRWRATLE